MSPLCVLGVVLRRRQASRNGEVAARSPCHPGSAFSSNGPKLPSGCNTLILSPFTESAIPFSAHIT